MRQLQRLLGVPRFQDRRMLEDFFAVLGHMQGKRPIVAGGDFAADSDAENRFRCQQNAACALDLDDLERRCFGGCRRVGSEHIHTDAETPGGFDRIGQAGIVAVADQEEPLRIFSDGPQVAASGLDAWRILRGSVRRFEPGNVWFFQRRRGAVQGEPVKTIAALERVRQSACLQLGLSVLQTCARRASDLSHARGPIDQNHQFRQLRHIACVRDRRLQEDEAEHAIDRQTQRGQDADPPGSDLFAQQRHGAVDQRDEKGADQQQRQPGRQQWIQLEGHQ